MAVTSYDRNKNLDEIKNIAGQVLTYNSENFHLLKKLDLEWTITELGKPFLKKSDQKKLKKQKTNVKMPHVNKKTTKHTRQIAGK